MADKHPAHLLSAAATTTKGTAAPALQPADSPTAAQGPSTRASAHHLQAATLGRSGDLDRRSSADSTADMQVDHDAQYSVDMTSDAAAFATSNYRAGANGDDLLSLPPVRQSQSSEAPRPSAQGSHRTRGDSSPPPPGSAAHKLQPASAHSGQSEEDIRMSESPGLVTAAGYAVGEPTRRLPVRAPESTSPRPASTQRSQSSTRQEPDDDDDDDEDDDGDDDDGLKQSDGVTMPAKSALLYHAGYNSGRGAVWRFFRVVEARVSGNTDRAECLLCQKRMLGKSADMKKHIVGNCPNRSEISEDMQPILEIVKAELENPKKRAKRNSNTPITIRSDGSFAPVSSAYASAHADPSASSGRVHMASLRQTPPSARTPTHARPAPYDLHHHHHAHADAHRTKVSKYSREYMQGGSSTHFDGPGGASEYSGSYAHGPSAIPAPLGGHAARQQAMQPAMDPRMRSQGGGFPSRHSGYPLTPSIQPSIQPPPPSHPSHPSHSAHPVHPIHHPPQQSGMSPPRSQQHVRYYPSPSSGQIPQQQGPPPPRQGAPLPPQGMPPSRRPSQTPSPQTSSSGNLLSRLRYKLRRRIPVFGVWLTIPSPVTARALAAQGFDWACIDMEHTPLSPALMAEMVSAVASSGTCVPIVRVPSHSPEWFKWALDAGAHGVIVPMVNTPEELLNAQRLCRYPPAGKRSMGAYFAPNVFGLRGPRAVSDYVDYVSKEILVIPQIESVEGAVNLPNMLKAGGVDAVFVGPYDLSASVRGAPDMQVQDVMAHVEQSAKEYEVPLGIYAASGAAAGAKHRDGYTMIVAANDIECLMSSAADNLDRARGEARHFR